MINATEVKQRVDILTLTGQHTELRRRGRAWVGCCPLHREKTPSFTVDAEKQLWHCFGCGKGGDVLAFAQAVYQTDFPHAVERLAQMAGVPASLPPPAVKDLDPEAWRGHLDGLQPYAGSPAEAYLRGRGILPLFPLACRVRYHANWGGRPAVVFPLYNREERLVASEGRYLDGKDTPKVRAYGPKKAGVFATPGAFDGAVVTLVESPINALSLAQCGLPAVATCGAENLPAWLPTACRGKRVHVAFDPDPAGHAAAKKVCTLMAKQDIPCARLVPLEDGCDFNDVLMKHGRQWLEQKLQEVITPLDIP